MNLKKSEVIKIPSAVFSHQTPGLALKIKYPDRFDGTALCISSFVPDLTALIDIFLPFTLRGISHSFLGLFYYTIPLTLLLILLFRKKILPYISRIARKEGILSKPLNYLGVDVWDKLKNKKYDRKSVAIAIYSAFLGGLTHLLLDLPAHANVEFFFPWVIFQVPQLLLYSIWEWPYYNLTIYELLWTIESLITLVLTVYSFRYIKKNNLISKWYDEA